MWPWTGISRPEGALADDEDDVLLGKPERGLRTAAAVVLVGGGLGLYGLILLLTALRPGAGPARWEGIDVVYGVLGFLALLTAIVVFHEALHAVPLAIFARRRPTLGWRLPFYVSIRVPGARLPRNAMIAVLLTPLAAGTLAGLGMALAAPDGLVRSAKTLVLLNYLGSALDVFGAVWLLHYPAGTRVEDTPEGPRLYGPRRPHAGGAAAVTARPSGPPRDPRS